jgi:hypothetical protein
MKQLLQLGSVSLVGLCITCWLERERRPLYLLSFFLCVITIDVPKQPSFSEIRVPNNKSRSHIFNEETSDELTNHSAGRCWYKYL